MSGFIAASGFALPLLDAMEADQLQKIPTPKNTGARPSELPGPAGETCGSCTHACGTRHSSRTYYKCALVKATRGGGTDIRLKDPACSRFEKEVTP